MALIFAFDIGTTSIGSAVINHDPGRKIGKILRLGVRIFPETREPKTNAPLNQQRRAKRMMRRQLRRRRARRRTLNEALSSAGLLPAFGTSQWDRLMRLDPYDLRSRGLTEALEPEEFGRAIYHLAQRRHFRGRDIESESEDDNADSEELAARAEAKDMLATLRQSGMTLGQWLNQIESGKRKRGIHAARSTVEDEFERLWAAQEAHNDKLKDPEFQSSIRKIIFYQRPVFWRQNTLGSCPLIPGAELCPKGSWLSMQRRMLEKLNNLELVGAGARKLDPEERMAILESLQSQASMSWAGVRKALSSIYRNRNLTGEEKRLKFNLEIGGEKGLIGNPLEQRIAAIVGKSWSAHPHKQKIREALHERLWKADYRKIGTQRVVIQPQKKRRLDRLNAAESIVKEFELPGDLIQPISEISFPSGWEPYSIDALLRIIPELENGTRFGELLVGPELEDWRTKTFPDRIRPTGQISDRLPSPSDPDENRRLRSIRNPTVVRCQNELRKVVNNLIDVYGKPDIIRVELARDVGRSKRDREEFQRVIRQRETERKAAIRDLETNGIVQPSRSDIEKWLLWKESGQICPYTGDAIGFDDLFRTGRFEVEHIWPRSRCLDDSFANKTLCRSDINKEKGNRTPYEHLGSNTDQWHRMQDRLKGMVRKGKKPGMAFSKTKRFLAKEIPDDFTHRMLNDTSYAARESVNMLKQLWPQGGANMPVTVQVVSGRVTAQLRRLWGLNNLLHDGAEKTRADHRHHAVDALVVASCNPGITQSLSRYWKLRESPSAETHPIPLPWPEIRQDATQALDKVIVSHRVSRKLSGPLHEETHFGDTGLEAVRRGTIYRQYVRRKPLHELSPKELDCIRDPAVQSIVRKWVNARGGDPKKAFSDGYPKLGTNGPEIKKVRLVVEKRPELTIHTGSGVVDKGKNHHLAVYRNEEGKLLFRIVSLNEARTALAELGHPVAKTEASAKLLFSLSAGDCLSIPDGDETKLWIVSSTWAEGRVTISETHDAAGQTKTNPSILALVRKGALKVSVDPIGRVRPARD